MAVNDFDRVARYYDKLAGLIFGKSLIRATERFLGSIIKDDSVLILGGGTGALLEAIPACDKIVYLDQSTKMVDLARNRNVGHAVDFICADFLSHQLEDDFDVIICPFFLDCFNEENLTLVIEKIKKRLTKNGRLIVIDFQDRGSSWLIGLMHLFFRLVSSLESRKLKNIHQFIVARQFDVENEEFFHKNLIFSRVYKSS